MVIIGRVVCDRELVGTKAELVVCRIEEEAGPSFTAELERLAGKRVILSIRELIEQA